MILIKNLSDPFSMTTQVLFEHKSKLYILPFIGSLYETKHNYLSLIKDMLV